MVKTVFDLENSKKTARIAGLLYLLVIVFGVSAELVRRSLIVSGDAATTAHNIMANELLYRLAFMSDLIMISCFILLPLALYVLLKPVNKNLASLMVIFVLLSVPVMFINRLIFFAPLLLLNGADFLTVFEANQLHAQVMFFLDLYLSGVMIATVFHGLWLLPLGYLIYKSSYFPRIFGVLLMLACFGFLIQSLQYFLFPGYEIVASLSGVITVIGEFGFTGWLLVKGIKIP